MRGGKALSQALDARREVFCRFYVNIIRAGEAGGALGTVLPRLADTMERNKELRESVISALIYPTILVSVAVLSLMLILAYVVPQFEQTFAQAGQRAAAADAGRDLPRHGVKQWWWAIAALVVLAVLWMRRRLRDPVVRGRWDARILRAPLLGDVMTKVETARFARTLATLLANGVTLLSGLAIVRDTLGNSVLANALDGVIARLREGKGFGTAARRDRTLSEARRADDPGRRGVRTARGDAEPRRRGLRPRSGDGDQALPRGAGAGADPVARRADRRRSCSRS